MDVVLVTMPWQSLDRPSLPLGILRSVSESNSLAIPNTYYGNLRWMEYCQEKEPELIQIANYFEVSEGGISNSIGDWIFSDALNGRANGDYAEYKALLEASGVDIQNALNWRKHAKGFINLAAQEVLAMNPKIIGISTTFMQNAASLAFAAQVKNTRPDVLIVFGGGNCDGPMGASLHRNFDQIDYVVRGEGEEAFPALVKALSQGKGLEQIPGLCWRAHGKSIANAEQRTTIPPGRIPVPNYDDWFAALSSSPLGHRIQPAIALETSRGCWWGEAHQCTFCGLNGSSIQFRSKSPHRVIEELRYLVNRHGVLDIITVDNIIDSSFYSRVLPDVASLSWDLRIHYEVKANLRADQIAALRDAGVVSIQPGIESLSTEVLKIMDKGVTAIQNIRTLRDCESAGITAAWNWLVGFPGEISEYYRSIARQVSALVHLQPPSPGPSRLQLHRFSPYFEQQELGFINRGPNKSYSHIYDLPEIELRDLVYQFESDEYGISGAILDNLREAVDRWIEAYPTSGLTRSFDGHRLSIKDTRFGWPATELTIEDPVLVSAYMELESGRSMEGLLRRLREQGYSLGEDEINRWLEDMVRSGLVFSDGNRYITLATAMTPIKGS
ncbi:RiPP maturation radical SAM C-methyltransferase [Streptomyces virginiae]|uniref:RiPP maturation radical SAM C-methyltransferase n=1 Tax=Streptomyces virginiae TaxID=1961 RepID=UPI0036AA751D